MAKMVLDWINQQIAMATALDAYLTDAIEKARAEGQTDPEKIKFVEEEVQKQAAEVCRKHKIDGIVVIGGDGSYRGALALSHHGINTITIERLFRLLCNFICTN